MLAWIVHDFGDMRLEEVAEPPAPAPGWAVIRVIAVQPSITETLLFRGLPTYQLDFVRERLRQGPQQLFGHEYLRRGRRRRRRRAQPPRRRSCRVTFGLVLR